MIAVVQREIKLINDPEGQGDRQGEDQAADDPGPHRVDERMDRTAMAVEDAAVPGPFRASVRAGWRSWVRQDSGAEGATRSGPVDHNRIARGLHRRVAITSTSRRSGISSRLHTGAPRRARDRPCRNHR